MNSNFNPRSMFQNMISMGTNPQQIEQMIYAQNPQLRILANQMKQSGMSPLQFAIQYARQNNIPINENILNQQYQSMVNMIPRNPK